MRKGPVPLPLKWWLSIKGSADEGGRSRHYGRALLADELMLPAGPVGRAGSCLTSDLLHVLNTQHSSRHVRLSCFNLRYVVWYLSV